MLGARGWRRRAGPLCWLAMRIIAGTYRSRAIAAPRGLGTRPTSDRMRETLFNVLSPRIGEAAFLDLYAGSGAVGIEALSRGVVRITFVERAPAALRVLRQNLERLGIESGFRLDAGSVGAFLRSAAQGGQKPEIGEKVGGEEHYDIVFLDPPYDEVEQYRSTLGLLGGAAARLLAPGAVVIAEHSRKHALDERYGGLVRMRLLEQGDAALSFFTMAPVGRRGRGAASSNEQ